MTRTRTLYALAVSMVLALLMAACGDADDGTAEEPTDDPAAEEPDAEDADPEQTADDGEFVWEDGVLQPMADGFPERPISLVNLFEVGDASDIYLRAMAEAAQDLSPVPIETDQQQQGPDLAWGFHRWLETQPEGTEGYYLTETSFPSYPIRYLQVELGPGHHYERINPVILNAEQNFAVGVPEDSDFDDIEELVGWAQDNPEELRATVMIASQLQFALIMLGQEADFAFRQIPAENPVDSVTTMLGGGADMVMTTAEPLLAQVDGGDARVLLQIGSERVPAMDDVPTSAEMGWDIPLGTRRGLSTHPDVSLERREWLFELFQAASETDEFQTYLEDIGGAGVMEGPAEIAEGMDEVHDTIRPIMEELDLVVEGND